MGFFSGCVLLWKGEMDEKLAERGGWVRFCHFLGLFLLKIRLYLSVDFLIALADFLILSADTIRMLADSLIVSAGARLRLRGWREKEQIGAILRRGKVGKFFADYWPFLTTDFAKILVY
ncbi:hypothetical protein [Alloprevotella rava]|uniref:Uncharacterized protein n=1 Tax=Alloprevotella rava TaxID=671218 RepID=A0A7W5UI39_9BACT|nr:hypothetical protein [Alloprevotella rava]MBB3702916.1 hypothetical protein [Alloprevotella rava]